MAVFEEQTALGNSLKQLLMADDIEPGADASYECCKVIYEYHPLGAKMAETPISMAQSQTREIIVAKAGTDRAVKAFLTEWDKMGNDKLAFNVKVLSRVYGNAALAVVVEGVPPNRPLDLRAFANPDTKFAINVLDPLNTAGSNVLSQDPNSLLFLRSGPTLVQGTPYHPSRVIGVTNGLPIYISYTESAFGFTGRSVYQRALFPLKSFVQTLKTDDLVTRKAGVLVAKIKQVGSAINNVMQAIAGAKRAMLKEATTDDVLQVGHEDDVTSLNMQNLDGAYGMARKNIIENVASSADMPAKILDNQTFVLGFGEGTEDAKAVANYIASMRVEMKPIYDFLDLLTMYRAWTPQFFAGLQSEGIIPKEITFFKWFYDCKNSFEAVWPSLLTEPPSEKVKVDETKMKGITSLMEAIGEQLDPENKRTLLEWAVDNFNELENLFTKKLLLDYDAVAQFAEEQQEKQEQQQKDQLEAMKSGAGAAQNAAGGNADNGNGFGKPKPAESL